MPFADVNAKLTESNRSNLQGSHVSPWSIYKTYCKKRLIIRLPSIWKKKLILNSLVHAVLCPRNMGESSVNLLPKMTHLPAAPGQRLANRRPPNKGTCVVNGSLFSWYTSQKFNIDTKNNHGPYLKRSPPFPRPPSFFGGYAAVSFLGGASRSLLYCTLPFREKVKPEKNHGLEQLANFSGANLLVSCREGITISSLDYNITARKK